MTTTEDDDVARPAASRPILIEPGSLTRCRHRLALESSHPELVSGVAEDSGVQQRREAALAHRDAVRDALVARQSGWVVIDPTGDRVAATMAALAAGAPRIWGAMLPAEPDTGRRGGVEILLRDDVGYLPVIVVNHKVTDPRPSDDGPAALITEFDAWAPRPDPERKVRPQLRDQLRLAQVQRMLERHGYASPRAVGGVIGMAFDCVLVHDLSAVLSEYDARFADRLAVARGEVATLPSQIGECRSCPWWSRCQAQLREMRDVSLVAPGARADVVRGLGLATIDQLAEYRGAAPEDWQFGDFADIVVTARAWLAGVPLVRRVAHVTVPRADIEVDVDLESYQEHGAYLWGTLLDDGTRAPEYRPFVTWDPLPTADEGRSFGAFWTWLSDIRARAEQSGKTFAAYCYSRTAEDKWLLDSARRFAGVPGVPAVDEVKAFIGSPQWVDIFAVVNDQFICPNGKGLKKIAPVAGFSWRDPEAGGEASMSWYRAAVGYDAAPALDQRERLLHYNEDDVLATRALRLWMSERADTEIPHSADL